MNYSSIVNVVKKLISFFTALYKRLFNSGESIRKENEQGLGVVPFSSLWLPPPEPDMDLLILYAMTFVGTPYRWGGPEKPFKKNEASFNGYDCSGLVQELLRSVGADPPGDQTAQKLFDYFSQRGGWGLESVGALAFFGKDAMNISHVGMLLDAYRMIEAGGGDSSTTTRKRAIEQSAFVRIRPLTDRKNLVAIIKPHYVKVGMT